MKDTLDLNKELQQNTEAIAQELQKGNDIIIKNTNKGIKIQSLKVKNL